MRSWRCAPSLACALVRRLASSLHDVDFLRRTLSIRRQIQGQVNSKTVEVSPKYESARTVYLPDDLVTVLAAHLENHPPMGEERWLFSLNGYVYNRNSSGNQWRSLRAKVGMEAFTLHDLGTTSLLA